MIILKKIKKNKMLSYNGIQVLFDCCAKFFNNVKTKFLEYKIKIVDYKNKLIQIKDNRIEKIKEIKSSKYNELIQVKNKTKEKIIIKYNNFYRYWLNNYEKIK